MRCSIKAIATAPTRVRIKVVNTLEARIEIETAAGLDAPMQNGSVVLRRFRFQNATPTECRQGSTTCFYLPLSEWLENSGTAAIFETKNSESGTKVFPGLWGSFWRQPSVQLFGQPSFSRKQFYWLQLTNAFWRQRKVEVEMKKLNFVNGGLEQR
ncbi:hypothetical protein OUZ56_010727 [Daphnia magna]|uniref:Uncharacterized protein n=1 Tax=Daphnia magna TaxID=35525 RepID=A0ABQ9YYF8_9CRUS|nr:hypothetical protein OUZ56_010727 [Daphnia magna]